MIGRLLAVGLLTLSACASTAQVAEPEPPFTTLDLGVRDYSEVAWVLDGDLYVDHPRYAQFTTPSVVVLRSMDDVRVLQEQLMERPPDTYSPYQGPTPPRVPGTPFVYFEQEMVIGLQGSFGGSGGNTLSIDAVVPSADTIRVYGSLHQECVTTGSINYYVPFVVVQQDPRPVVLMPLRIVRRGIYGLERPDGTRPFSPCD